MFKNLLAKVAGKFIGSKLKLEDGPVNESKKWYQSKTIWAGVYVILRGAYDGVRTLLVPSLPEVPGVVDTIIAAIVGKQVISARLDSANNKPIG